MPPFRLQQVLGNEGRVNDTLFQPAAGSGAQGRETLVFFGGDVQDYPEIMEAHRDNRNYLMWNLESTARMLGTNFPDKHILVVRPSRIEYKCFSCYDNFVRSSSAGAPQHAVAPRALTHLHRSHAYISISQTQTPSQITPKREQYFEDDAGVATHGSDHICVAGGYGCGAVTFRGVFHLKLVVTKLQSDNTDCGPHHWDCEFGESFRRTLPIFIVNVQNIDPLWWRSSLALHEGSLSLVGFSKGCVVLNQVVHEFHYTQTKTPCDENMTRLSARVRELYWLDGGHAGGRGAWLTAGDLLHALAASGVKIYVHVSPYQVEDKSRPWIGQEEKIFTSSLKRLGAKVLRYRHEARGPPSLHTHFAVLGNFKQLQDSATSQQE